MKRGLSVEGLSAGYGAMKIVQSASFEAEVGEVVALCGPNGCGKTTVLRAILGLLPEYGGKVTAGEVHLFGQEITGSKLWRLARRRVAFLPSGGPVFESMTVLKNLELGGLFLKDSISRRRRTRDVMEEFPLIGALRGRRAGTLSGGERQLLSLARALMLDPLVLVLDEPLAGLSGSSEGKVLEKLGALAGEGRAVLVVEQRLQRLSRLVKRAYLMCGGSTIGVGSGLDILNDLQRTVLGSAGCGSVKPSPDEEGGV